MSMPYHKELLRSSVSLCFREFFVFRNKAKGIMTLLCQFEKMIYPSGTGAADAASFMIALYRPCEKLKDSSGNTITQIKAVGYCLPTAGNMRYEMRGHWRKDPKYGIQYDVEGYEEQIIPTREGIIAYLSSGQIKGIGPKMAERIYDAFGNMALEVLDKKPEKLLTISGISQNKLKKICDSYLANRGARDVVAFLSPHGITPNRAVKLYKEYGEQTMDIVKNHPYKLCEMVGVGFKTADKIAMSMGIDRLSPERVDEGRFRCGDKVMQIKNCDEISNGDIGYITKICKAGDETTVTIDFGDGRMAEYDTSQLDMLDLGYASTIHKSQGSEYRSVIINLQCAHYVMLTRPLVYTAITRGKENVIIVGERRALCMAIKKTDTEKRGTCLAKRLRAAMQ